MVRRIEWQKLETQKLNYFKFHRLFVVKGFQCSANPIKDKAAETGPNNNNSIIVNNYSGNNNGNTQQLYEFVDIKREMGEFVPNDI